MDFIQKRSLSLLLEFIFKEKNVDDAVKLHNDLLDLYFEHHECNDIQELRIFEPMLLKDIWLKGRFLLHWTLFDVNQEVISQELAEIIFSKFNHAYNLDRRFSIL